MATGTPNIHSFLRRTIGSEALERFCQSRSIAFQHVRGFPMKDGDEERWLEAVGRLHASEQARVEAEVAQVNELANADAIALLVEGARVRELPADSVPGETALALWFLLHHPDLFHDVSLRHEVGAVDSWRTARARPGIELDEWHSCQAALARSLQEYFRTRTATGRFCAVDVYRLDDCVYFAAHLSDRLHLLDVFTDEGEHTTHTARPSFAVLFAYYPADGRILLQTRLRSADKILELFQRFARAVLGITLDPSCLEPLFQLDVLKRRCALLADAPDMEAARVKALHLAYPERSGRRRIKLETVSGDEPDAVFDLLQAHGGGEHILDHLSVVYAELEVRLWRQGRSRSHAIRLWPNRSNLTQTVLGERLRACLIRWGLAYAP